MKKEGYLVRKKKTHFKKNKVFTGFSWLLESRVDLVGQLGLTVFLLLPVFHLTWIGQATESTNLEPVRV
jgi:hypothetical protein